MGEIDRRRPTPGFRWTVYIFMATVVMQFSTVLMAFGPADHHAKLSSPSPQCLHTA
ncbi:MAG: hypothetical protein AAGJ74_15070 [Pseudomonadota bacterium]